MPFNRYFRRKLVKKFRKKDLLKLLVGMSVGSLILYFSMRTDLPLWMYRIFVKIQEWFQSCFQDQANPTPTTTSRSYSSWQLFLLGIGVSLTLLLKLSNGGVDGSTETVEVEILQKNRMVEIPNGDYGIVPGLMTTFRFFVGAYLFFKAL